MKEIIQAIDLKTLIDVLEATIMIPAIYVLAKRLKELIKLCKNVAEDKIEESDLSENVVGVFMKYLPLIERELIKSVECTAETFVDAIKGTEKWNKDAMKEAFMKTKESFEAVVGEGIIDLIKEVYFDYNEWLRTNVESILGKLKKEDKK